MADITLISGSTLGGAEYVAEHLAEKLEDAGFSTQTLHGPLLEDLPTDGVWLLITSTHGAGDLPDNLQPLYDELLEQQPDLSNVRFGATSSIMTFPKIQPRSGSRNGKIYSKTIKDRAIRCG